MDGSVAGIDGVRGLYSLVDRSLQHRADDLPAACGFADRARLLSVFILQSFRYSTLVLRKRLHTRSRKRQLAMQALVQKK